jgi:hypothetical protein
MGAGSGFMPGGEPCDGRVSSSALARVEGEESPVAVRRRRRTLVPAAIEIPSASRTARDQAIAELCRIA